MHPAYKRRRRSTARTIRNTLITVFVLLVLFVGGGVGYVWYSGKHQIQDAKTVSPGKPQQYALPKPRQPNPNAPESAAVEALLTPVKPGENSSITVRTLAKSTCTISVSYKDVPSKDSGLTPKIADDYGSVTWSWTVDKTAAPGKWPVKVTCTYNKKSAFVQGDLVVVK